MKLIDRAFIFVTYVLNSVMAYPTINPHHSFIVFVVFCTSIVIVGKLLLNAEKRSLENDTNRSKG